MAQSALVTVDQVWKHREWCAVASTTSRRRSTASACPYLSLGFLRMLSRTYIAVRPKHLGAYLDEEIFRYNERENTDGPRFVKVVKAADGKRLTYRVLTTRIP